MKIIIFAAVFACVLSAAIAAPRSQSRPVSIASVKKLKAPLTMAAVEKAFGPSTAQPGPCVTYPCAGRKGMSLWFWLRSNQRPSTTYLDCEVGCVILASTVTEEKEQVVWPPESAGESPCKLIKQVNDTYAPAR